MQDSLLRSHPDPFCFSSSPFLLFSSSINQTLRIKLIGMHICIHMYLFTWWWNGEKGELWQQDNETILLLPELYHKFSVPLFFSWLLFSWFFFFFNVLSASKKKSKAKKICINRKKKCIHYFKRCAKTFFFVFLLLFLAIRGKCPQISFCKRKTSNTMKNRIIDKKYGGAHRAVFRAFLLFRSYPPPPFSFFSVKFLCEGRRKVVSNSSWWMLHLLFAKWNRVLLYCMYSYLYFFAVIFFFFLY